YLDAHPELSKYNNWLGESAMANNVTHFKHRQEALREGYPIRNCVCEEYIGYVKDGDFHSWGKSCLRCGRLIE
ncbi:MAG: hypothetical protein M0R06_00910, partial [Sphaerochaeta sp.]|nr:hypothetical protein [Sphaerochaeta sp.]